MSGVLLMEEKNEKVSEREIDISAILNILKRHVVPLVLVTVIFASGFYVYSRYFITKQYEASATLIVNNRNKNKSAVNSAEITAAQGLADVYSIIIKSDAVMVPVVQNLNLNETSDQLKKYINVSTVDSTQVISITMTHKDADYAKKVIAEIVKVAPPIIQKKVAAGSVKIISAARITHAGAPVSPNNVKNGLIGAAIGFLITLAVVVVKEFSNNTFKTEEDITNSLGLPILGMIPAIDTKSFNKSV